MENQEQNNSPYPEAITKETPFSTQSNLLISEIRNNMLVMKDGSFRAVIACKSINFDLMSTTEQEGIEYSYQAFINSLTFTTQILIHSQRIDIGPYLDKLANIRNKTNNMLLGVLMDDYINFIDVIAAQANIMDKSFYVVIPYYTSDEAEKIITQTKSLMNIFSAGKQLEATRINRPTFEKASSEMTNRSNTVVAGLQAVGIQAIRLGTRELATLFYNMNNPGIAQYEPLVDFTRLATLYTDKGPNPGQNPDNQSIMNQPNQQGS